MPEYSIFQIAESKKCEIPKLMFAASIATRRFQQLKNGISTLDVSKVWDTVSQQITNDMNELSQLFQFLKLPRLNGC